MLSVSYSYLQLVKIEKLTAPSLPIIIPNMSPIGCPLCLPRVQLVIIKTILLPAQRTDDNLVTNTINTYPTVQ